MERADKTVIQNCHFKDKQKTQTSSPFFGGGECILCLDWNNPAVIWESLNPWRQVPAPVLCSSSARICFLSLHGPTHVVLLRYVAPMIFLTAASDLILLFRQNDWGTHRVLWLIEVRYFSDFGDKQMCACTLGAQSGSHEEPLGHQVTQSACRLQSLNFDLEIIPVERAPLWKITHSPIICSETHIYTT